MEKISNQSEKLKLEQVVGIAVCLTVKYRWDAFGTHEKVVLILLSLKQYNNIYKSIN